MESNEDAKKLGMGCLDGALALHMASVEVRKEESMVRR